ncbi:hypothetical protein [Nodosilinea sp. P-1105]|uniref:hypothetical protein n=1 Tax=Nodosilinea sp. P-1105 TaxID=2546229 RepID=UPI00146AB276|nr:hypothetical protein [Nodosilinea sp. P-1105]NMF82694.1 hypothetical protein [Nodosilinea sp. P-1105]
MIDHEPLTDLTLHYPALDLFLYDLLDGLGESAATVDQRRQQIWQSILNGQLTETALEATLTEIKEREKKISRYIELLPEKRLRFTSPYDGYYYPVKLDDTLSVMVHCSGKPQDDTLPALSFAEQLQQMKAGVLDHARSIPRQIGQSWLIWGQLPNSSQSTEATAHFLYDNLALFSSPNWDQDFRGQGHYQEATLFEFQRPDSTPDNQNQHHYALICLFPACLSKGDLQDIMSQFYCELMRLFHYRNKVLWVYKQSIQLKTTLKAATSTMQRLTDALPMVITQPKVDLDQLQRNLAIALQLSQAYETNLGYFREQESTIEVNIQNYGRRLQVIEKQDSDCDLAFLWQFEELAKEKYLAQLQTDEKILTAGFKPLENYTKTVAGIIDIEHSKNERKLNLTIASASAGLGAASLMAATFNDQAKQLVAVWMPPPQGQTQPPVASYLASTVLAFGVSASMGVLFAWLTYRLLRRRG